MSPTGDYLVSEGLNAERIMQTGLAFQKRCSVPSRRSLRAVSSPTTAANTPIRYGPVIGPAAPGMLRHASWVAPTHPLVA